MITKHRTQLLELLSQTDIDAVRQLAELFKANGYSLYLVGGCVRDLMLGRDPKDIDLCTDATPEEMKRVLDTTKDTTTEFKSWDSGLKHGTITVTNEFPYYCSYEITTFRGDGDYSDHRRPDSVEFTKSLEEDLKRRDLTINSFAYDILNEDLCYLDESYFYDLQVGVIRAVGEATKRFTEDALRMLRAIRFSAQLGFSFDNDTFSAISELAETIKYISHERIRDELTKIIMSDYPQMLELLALTGLETYVNLPISAMLNESQHNKYHYTDTFHHTIDVVKSVPKDFELRWAAFFHDFGKMSCVSTDEDGWQHYYGHPEVSAELALAYMKDYKFDNKSSEAIYKLVKYHDAAIGVNVKKKGMKKLINNVGEDLMTKFFKLTFADRLAHKLDNTAFSITQLDSGKKKYIDIMTNSEPMKIKDLKINGNDLVQLGFTGKQIGVALNKCLDTVLEHPEYNEKATLIDILFDRLKV